MPVVSKFYGIMIKMFFEEHNPPHFHVEYAEHNAVVSIAELKIIRGKLPRRAANLVLDWAEIHQQELLADWELCQKDLTPKPIKPLE
jgi:hypothetical protein